jgi:thiamine kinase-like enzyme
MLPSLQPILVRVPALAHADPAHIQRLGGVTNTNYLISSEGEKYVLRVSGENTSVLGINRRNEYIALQTAAKAGIGAEVAAFLLPEGHLVTRYIEGRHWTVEEYRTPAVMKRVVETVKRVHALPPVDFTFSPFRRMESYTDWVRSMGVATPLGFERLITHAAEIEAAQLRDPSNWRAFCHNDLFSVNFMDDGKDVRILDWEFAGMGDIYFDLVALVYAYDSDGPLPPDLEEELLLLYFGRVTPQHRLRLEGMKFMLMLFTALWGLAQYGQVLTGTIPPAEDFDYLAYANEIFASPPLVNWM